MMIRSVAGKSVAWLFQLRLKRFSALVEKCTLHVCNTCFHCSLWFHSPALLTKTNVFIHKKKSFPLTSLFTERTNDANFVLVFFEYIFFSASTFKSSFSTELKCKNVLDATHIMSTFVFMLYEANCKREKERKKLL